MVVGRWSDYLPELCGDVVDLLLVLQDLLAVPLEQQRGHTQPVLVEAFKLHNKAAVDFRWFHGATLINRRLLIFSYFYLSDVEFLQSVQERRENGGYLRLEGVTCEAIR